MHPGSPGQHMFAQGAQLTEVMFKEWAYGEVERWCGEMDAKIRRRAQKILVLVSTSTREAEVEVLASALAYATLLERAETIRLLILDGTLDPVEGLALTIAPTPELVAVQRARWRADARKARRRFSDESRERALALVAGVASFRMAAAAALGDERYRMTVWRWARSREAEMMRRCRTGVDALRSIHRYVWKALEDDVPPMWLDEQRPWEIRLWGTEGTFGFPFARVAAITAMTATGPAVQREVVRTFACHLYPVPLADPEASLLEVERVEELHHRVRDGLQLHRQARPARPEHVGRGSHRAPAHPCLQRLRRPARRAGVGELRALHERLAARADVPDQPADRPGGRPLLACDGRAACDVGAHGPQAEAVSDAPRDPPPLPRLSLSQGRCHNRPGAVVGWPRTGRGL